MFTPEEKNLYDFFIKSGLKTIDLMYSFLQFGRNVLARDATNRGEIFEVTAYIKRECQRRVTQAGEGEAEELAAAYWEAMLLEAPYLFESFIFYMEKNRDPAKRFYEPRRMTLKTVVDDMQALEDGKYRFYGLSMPSRVGKSTICLLFLSWIACKRPNSHSAMGGHSGFLARGFYKELLNFMTTDEYAFSEIYGSMHPGRTLIRDKSADEYTITLDKHDRFATITCRGADGTWTGAIDVSSDGYLYVDDLVRDRAHSLSPERMESTFQEYLNKMVDRKNDGARELMVGTLWNVMDPLERMRKLYEGQPGYLFRRIPALDGDDESNFAYAMNGFSTAYYREMRERLDRAEWEAKYQQRPFVREGLVFPEDELRFFNGVLPEGDCRAVAAVDIAWGGGDRVSMPIGMEYENGDVYIIDWVFSPGTKEATMPAVAGKIMEHGIRQIRFEGDQGGELYCQDIDRMLQDAGYKCSCSARKAPKTMEKKAKILGYSGYIKQKFLFLGERKAGKEGGDGGARYRRGKEYGDAMAELMTFASIGKNPHDDAVDGLTQLAMFIESPDVQRKARITGSMI